MGWSQVVHDNRKRAELTRALDEHRRRKRGYDIEVTADARFPALFTLLGASIGAVWWKREGRKLHGRDWRNLPGMQQLLSLLNGGKKPSRTPARGKAKPKQSAKAAVLKAAAAKPAASCRPQQQQLAAAQAGTPAAAAAAAAIQRQVAGNSSSSSSTSAKPKKKKQQKKKR